MKYSGLFERLLANSIESERHSHDGTPCWEWTGYRLPKGYGRVAVRVPGKPNPQGMAPHRVMAELVLRRPLDPDQETVEHACCVTWCVNPLHLELATRAANTADMRARRLGGPRLSFRPLVDPDLYAVDRLVRSLPVLRSELSADCPF